MNASTSAKRSTEMPQAADQSHEASPGPRPRLALRGLSSNKMLDSAWSLFGLHIRLSSLEESPDIKRLYSDISHQIRSIIEQLRPLGYDDASLQTCSYSLCLLMDEVVMERPWGLNSEWSQRSLLSEFHQETWGGEKFFTLLERMSQEAARYQDVLEVMYYCVCLGLRGKYAIHPDGDNQLENIIARLHRHIRELRGPRPPFLTPPLAHVTRRPLKTRRQWPWWTPWPIAGVLLVVIYTSYAMRLDRLTQEVIASLERLLTL